MHGSGPALTEPHAKGQGGATSAPRVRVGRRWPRGWESPEEGAGKASCRRGHWIRAWEGKEEFAKPKSDVQRSGLLVLEFTFCL